MSLYNMVLGYHPLVGTLLQLLGYTRENHQEIPRFRDCYIFQDEIRLLTRTGGGNRPDYEVENQVLRERPNFLRDWDDGYDATFAWWAYSWPEDKRTGLQSMFEAIEKIRPELLPEDLEARFKDALDNIGQYLPECESGE